MNQGPNVRLMRVAAQLELLAKDVTTALEHVQAELGILDSYPTQTPGASIATGVYHEPHPHPDDCVGCDTCDPVDLTRVERAAFARYYLTAQREQIRDDIDAIEQLATSLGRVLDKTLRHRVPRIGGETKLCDPTGREGAEIPLSGGGWSDATCRELAAKAGLCNRCYMRERRYRIANNLPTRQEVAA